MVRSSTLFAVLCCACGGEHATERATHAPVASASPIRATTSVADAWKLCDDGAPMQIAGSREYVDVTLPDKPALRFHVDTGGSTPGLTLRRSVAERLGFASEDALPKTIRIGARDLALPEGARWLIIDDANTYRDFADGQLGAGFLSRYVVCIDPAKKRFGLGEPALVDVAPGDAKFVPLLMQTGGSNHARYPFVHLVLRDHGEFAGGYGVLLDTGATTSMLDKNKIDYQRTSHPKWATANGAFGDADMLDGQWSEAVLRVEDVAIDAPRAALETFGMKEYMSIDLGRATFVDRPTGTWSKMFGDVPVTMGSHGAIANDVLLGFKLLLDYPHERLFLERVTRDPDASASSSRVGLATHRAAGGCHEIRRITDTNDEATKRALSIGDVITNVSGRDACAMEHHELAAALAGAPGTKIPMSVRRGKTTSNVDVTTAELLVSR